MIDVMLKNMPAPLEIRQEDIPMCPKCGSFLMPNLRCDNRFVEKPHLHNNSQYLAFVNNSKDKKVVLFELGVGFNTPGIIRFPFEQITSIFPKATLVRINSESAAVPNVIKEKSISIQGDLLPIMQSLCSIVNT
jgi:NAD-dependent SIR2 family protein deacetylase